jgi:L-alanine-DL-glutamate epimerase-like enolase superfamily enzyme
MLIRYYPFRLQFRHPFRIAAGMRTGTDVVYVELEQHGVTGYGEAALPPYLPENLVSVATFLEKAKESLSLKITDAPPYEQVEQIDKLAPGNEAAKAALEIALWDLYGKLNRQPLYHSLGIEKAPAQQSTFTIGIGDEAAVMQGLKDGERFNLLKLKLGGDRDRETIQLLKRHSEKPFCVDVNQGWKDWRYALDMAHWLHEQGAFLLEQPLPKDKLDDIARVAEASPIPVILDESVRRLSDLQRVHGACQGINIKLMKSGGLWEAKQMIDQARQLNMKALIGCMSESSCAVTAAAHLSGLCDWADLDGPYLIANDPFKGMTIEDGYIRLKERDGVGCLNLERKEK